MTYVLEVVRILSANIVRESIYINAEQVYPLSNLILFSKDILFNLFYLLIFRIFFLFVLI